MPDADHRDRRTASFLWAMVALYGLARVLQLFTGTVPMLVVLGLHIVPALVFALVHGALRYRLRNSVLFILLFLIIGNLIENLGVATGFPFGHYYFNDRMGPKFFHVPIFLGVAYVGMGYVSWVLAEVIVKNGNPTVPTNVLRTPALAALIMTSWDFSQDPVWSTILHLWTWTRGGAYFGVPWSNFFGWLLTTFVIYMCFALLCGAEPALSERLKGVSRTGAAFIASPTTNYLWAAIVFYAVSAAGNLLLLLPRSSIAIVADPTGTQWRVRDITAAGALVSVFLMGSFAYWAGIKLRRTSSKQPQSAQVLRA